jgi:hypothetical protein
MKPFFAAAAIAVLGSLTLVVGSSATDETDPLAQQKAKLARLQTLVGQWRGVAQPQRGSTKGAWVEQAEWAWKFDKGQAKLVASIGAGKVFKSLGLEPTDNADEFAIEAEPAEGESLRYVGKLDDSGKLVAVVEESRAELPARITLRTVAGGDRLLVLYEKKSGTSDQLVRLAEVGYTRKGSSFGEGSGGPECVVTGGFGSIEVTYNGQKYYVCCTGCRDYFNEKPEEVLAEYAARKAEEKRKRAEEK